MNDNSIIHVMPSPQELIDIKQGISKRDKELTTILSIGELVGTIIIKNKKTTHVFRMGIHKTTSKIKKYYAFEFCPLIKLKMKEVLERQTNKEIIISDIDKKNLKYIKLQAFMEEL